MVYTEKTTFLDIPLVKSSTYLTVEKLLIILIILLAIFSRFYRVDHRVMSHDEVNHVVPAYDLYQGLGYRHDPVTHGPLQFHLLAASYFIMGDNDFSARVPAALFSVAAIVFVLFAFPRYLGRKGALLAGLFFLISPYLLYYGRYTRNEAFIELFAVMMLYAVLRYIDKRDNASLILLTITSALHFATKETAYIYTAQMMIFLAIYLFLRLLKTPAWKSKIHQRNFLLFSILAILLFVATFTIAVIDASHAEVNETGTAIEVSRHRQLLTAMIVVGAAFIAAAVADLIYLVKHIGWDVIRKEPSFDLLILLGITVLPLLVAFPVRIIGWDPLDYTTAGIIRTGGMLIIVLAITAALGFWWDRKKWTIHMGIFYGIFTIFYTTFFTNVRGFLTGIVGSLGYWLVQQSVERGTQPLYYYALVQMPIYEYLSIAGLILAVVLATKSWLSQPDQPDAADNDNHEKVPTFALLLFWSLMSLIAFSIAGERMPWLTVHIALPFSLTAAWGFAKFLDRIHWQPLLSKKTAFVFLLAPVFLISVLVLVGMLLSANPPFAGKELMQLQTTYRFLLVVLTAMGTGFGLFRLLPDPVWKVFGQLTTLSFFVLLIVLTARTAFMAAYVNADYATEFLVYAHASPAPKEILDQIETISYRLTGGKDLEIAYDNDSLYPYWWYLRDYPNKRYFAEQPTRDIANATIILASSNKYGKIDAIVRDNYTTFDYMRLWWPMQDYFGLTPARIGEILLDPPLRSAIFDIWLNRDYSAYSQVKGISHLTPETWSPGDQFRMYIRKDIVAQLWQYGVSPTFEVGFDEDLYMTNVLPLLADQVIGSPGSAPGQLSAPRGIAVASDGSIFVADANNHRIQHFAADGTLLNSWGTFANAETSEAPGGTFNEPWDVAVSPDGFVYVADTWNHRIQKFDYDGNFITAWGEFGVGETPYRLWGPRSVVVDIEGNVFITDTGNKRIIMYTADGDYLTDFGGAGFAPGEFDEPVGIALDPQGNLFIADTWNRRIQSVFVDRMNLFVSPITWWDVYGWYSQTLDNKPYITVSGDGYVYITDPEGYRVIQFDLAGNYISAWGDYSAGYDGFGLPSGIAADKQGGVWVSDAANNVLLHFTLP
jgi:predicted membrane-bound mannosyltransferase/DNA-binding beta-propeller fold protein YncE